MGVEHDAPVVCNLCLRGVGVSYFWRIGEVVAVEGALGEGGRGDVDLDGEDGVAVSVRVMVPLAETLRSVD